MEIGEIRKAREIGKVGNNQYIWHTCPDCGKQRWITPTNLRKSKDSIGRCQLCATKNAGVPGQGPKSHAWKGGKRHFRGYVGVWLAPNDFFYSMADKTGGVAEHRLIMAQHLGRCLQSWEIVHHKNGIRDDNRIENLELTTAGSHSTSHSKGYRDGYQKGLIDGRMKQIEELRQEIKLLQWHIREQEGKLCQ